MFDHSNFPRFFLRGSVLCGGATGPAVAPGYEQHCRKSATVGNVPEITNSKKSMGELTFVKSNAAAADVCSLEGRVVGAVGQPGTCTIQHDAAVGGRYSGADEGGDHDGGVRARLADSDQGSSPAGTPLVTISLSDLIALVEADFAGWLQ